MRWPERPLVVGWWWYCWTVVFVGGFMLFTGACLLLSVTVVDYLWNAR